MTAPAAPRIYVRSFGDTIRVRWQPVAAAEDYKLYVGNAAAPTGLEADVDDSYVGTDGWFQWTFVTEEDPTYIRLTALNLAAEESAYSNEVRVMNSTTGTSFGKAAPNKTPGTTSDPFGAL